VFHYSSNWGDELLEAVLFLLGEGAKVNVQNKVRWIYDLFSIDDFWDRMEELLYIMLMINLRYLGFWLNMVLKLILLEMWEIDDWMREMNENFRDAWSFDYLQQYLFTPHLSYHIIKSSHPYFYWFYLIFYHQLWDLISFLEWIHSSHVGIKIQSTWCCLSIDGS